MGWNTLLPLACVVASVAYQRAPATEVVPYLYSQVGFAVLFGWIVFGELPGLGNAWQLRLRERAIEGEIPQRQVVGKSGSGALSRFGSWYGIPPRRVLPEITLIKPY